MCHQAQEQKEEEEARLKQEKLEDKQQAKQREAKQKAQALSPPASSQSKGANNLTKVLPLAVGAGVLATAKTSKAQPKEKGRTKKKRQAKKRPLTQSKRSGLGTKGSIDKNQARKEKPVLTNPNPRSRGRMERRRKSRAERRVSSINSLTGSTLKTSSETPLQVAQANVVSRSCPSMPEIKSNIVFQSVEAPQIEPMSQQENFPYNNYELVMGKPAGVLVLLDHSIMDRNRNRDQKFAMNLWISDNTKLHEKCFHEPMKREMKGGEESLCWFTKEHLEIEGNYKFFPLPMQKKDWLQKNKVTHSVVLTLYPEGYEKEPSCHQKRSFNIKIIRTYDLELGFTGIEGGKDCYAVVSDTRVDDFAGSNEVLWNIPSMFPVAKIFSYFLKRYVKGTCNNRPARDRPSKTVGILSDVAKLERIRASWGYHKLIAIIPESYFAFHGMREKPDDNSVGFIISPKWKEWRGFWFWKVWRWKSGFLGGSWNIAFVHEGELNKGTVAHELAHTVGQGKEFYKDFERCRRFRGEPFESCKNYNISTVLDAWTGTNGQVWNFLKDKFSIMSNKGKTVDDLWIDRDTYQKTFKVLSEEAVIPNTEELFGESIVNREYEREKESSFKAVITGFYDEKERGFVAPDIEVQKMKLSTPSFYPNTENTKIPVIIFQLKEGKRILQRIKRPIFKMQMKTLYKNKDPEIEPFEFSPLMAVFKLPLDYKKRDLRIVALDPWKKVMYSVSVPKKQKPKLTEQSGNLVERSERR